MWNPFRKKEEMKKPRYSYNLGNGYCLTYENRGNSLGGYADVNVWFCKDEKPIRQITDETGKFLNFPGVEPGSWEKKLTRPMEPVTRFSVSYNPFKEDGLAEFVWLVQPDGRYWEDEDGFGAENDEEIKLYAKLDQNGQFVTPFWEKEDG